MGGTRLGKVAVKASLRRWNLRWVLQAESKSNLEGAGGRASSQRESKCKGPEAEAERVP